MQDYIMRMIEQFVQAIVSIMRRRKSGEYQEARKEAQVALRYFLKINTDLLFVYDSEQILEFLRDFSGHLETEKCVLTADLLYELALVEEAEKSLQMAIHLKRIALHLYVVGIMDQSRFQIPDYFLKIRQLIEELKRESLSEEAIYSLKQYQKKFSNELEGSFEKRDKE